MREYTTQMDAARKGIITPEMKIVAEKEMMGEEELRALIAEGKVIIPCNRLHTSIDPNGVGSMLKTKINVNLGTSRDWKDIDMELEKVNDAVKMGAESIMDLSSYGDTQAFRRKLTAECPAMIGTVPIYDAVVYYHKALKDITAEDCGNARKGWRGLHDDPCRHKQEHRKAFQGQQAPDEHCIERWINHLCMDDDDRGGESILRVL